MQGIRILKYKEGPDTPTRGAKDVLRQLLDPDHFEMVMLYREFRDAMATIRKRDFPKRYRSDFVDARFARVYPEPA